MADGHRRQPARRRAERRAAHGRPDLPPVSADGATMTPAAFEAALAELVANPPASVPLPGPLPELYRRALFHLAGPLRSGTVAFSADAARRTLGAAADSLALPRAGAGGAGSVDGPQPDPADVEAFLRALEAEGIASRSPGRFLLDRGTLPF